MKKHIDWKEVIPLIGVALTMSGFVSMFFADSTADFLKRWVGSFLFSCFVSVIFALVSKKARAYFFHKSEANK